MLEQSSIKADFDALCRKYELPVEDTNYIALRDNFNYRREGNPITIYEIYSDYSTLEMAMMLKQLSRMGKGGFTLQNVGGLNKYTYTSPLLVEVLKKSLEDALQERVEKIPEMEDLEGRKSPCLKVLDYYDGLHFGYPEGCVPQEKGFSDEELDIIIAGEERVKQSLEKELRGNKEKGEDGYTRLPDLGEQALMLLDSLPQDWNTRKKHCFIADYLFYCGILDFKSEEWKERFLKMEDKEKDRMVRNWIKADLDLNLKYP